MASRKPNNDGEHDESIEVRSPGGWFGRVGGTNLVPLFALAVGFAMLLWRIELHEESARGAVATFLKIQSELDTKEAVLVASRQADILKNQAIIIDATRQNLEELRVQTYIQTLTEPEKKALRLQEPPSLTARRRWAGGGP